MRHRRRIVVGVLLLAALCAVAWLLNDRGDGVPRVTRDCLAEINAPLEGMPEADRAWPRYRAAIARMAPDLSDWDLLRARRGTPEWSRFVASAERHQDAVAEIREAAKLPYLGYRYGYTADPEFAPTDPANLPQPGIGEGFGWIVPTAHEKLFAACLFLTMDAQLAADRQDGARVADDVIAVASMVRHLRETPLLNYYSLSASLLANAVSAFAAALEADPTMFTDEQLAAVLQAFDRAAEPDFKAVIALVQIASNDFEQRNFTDDGRGDGRFYGSREGILGSLLKGVGLSPGGAVRYNKVTRREFREKIGQLSEAALAELDRPLWTADKFASDYEMVRLADDERWPRGMFPLVILQYYQRQLLLMHVDALRIAVALEGYRRQHAELPERLEQLVPDYLDDVPLDRHDGQPLRYRIVSGGPLIYSVGPDRVDDSGDPLPMSPLNVVFGHRSQRYDALDLSAVGSFLPGDIILWPQSLAEDPADADAESDQQADAEPETAVP